MSSPRSVKLVLASLISVCLLSACTQATPTTTSATTEATSASSATPSTGPASAIPNTGAELFAQEGLAYVFSGTAVFGDNGGVVVSPAGAVPEVPGILAAGQGVNVSITGEFVGALQLRLPVPPPPNDDAIPVAIHRRDDGSIAIEPAIWDPESSQIVVLANQFSDRWGAWYDPRNWGEEVVQAGQGAFDFGADFVTGRTDPPACKNDPPPWATISTTELSSLHVCSQSVAGSSEDLELYLKSNRRTAQLLALPSDRTFLWSQDMPEDLRRLMTSLAGADPSTGSVLLGEHALSFGLAQPDYDGVGQVRSYQNTRLIVVNPILGLIGQLPFEGIVGVFAAVAKCISEVTGVDPFELNVTPTDGPIDLAFIEDMIRCGFEILQQPDLAFDTVAELASLLGISGGLEGIRSALKAIGPTVARLASGLAVLSVFTNAWDGVFDNLAEGVIDLTFNGARSAPDAPMGPEATLEQFIQAANAGDRSAMIALSSVELVDDFSSWWGNVDNAQFSTPIGPCFPPGSDGTVECWVNLDDRSIPVVFGFSLQEKSSSWIVVSSEFIHTE